MHFRILKMIATSGFLTALECTKFVFGPCWGSLQRSPRPPSWTKGGPTSKGKGRGKDGRERGRDGRGREGEGTRRGRGGGGKGEKGRGGEGTGPPFWKFLDPPLLAKQ